MINKPFVTATSHFEAKANGFNYFSRNNPDSL